MSILSHLSSSTRKSFSRSHNPFKQLNVRFSTALAATLLAAYALILVAAYYSSLTPGQLDLRIGIRQQSPYVSWVMPGGRAWSQGARPGMSVLSADGRSLTGVSAEALPREAVTEAEVQGDDGVALSLKAVRLPHEQSPTKFSLWVLSAIFALLGTAVLVRRPDLQAAKLFAVFSGFVALTLAMVPASGAPLGKWVPVLQVLAITGVGASCAPFVLSFLGSARVSGRFGVSMLFAGLGFALGGGFVVSVVASPALYQFLRPAILLFLSLSVFWAVGALAFRSSGPSSPGREQARIALWGMLLGTLPLIGLTLVPSALGREPPLPVYVTILPLGIIPAFFSYGVLRHHMWGIRRLVHRGMVYGIISFGLLVLVVLVVASGETLSPSDSPNSLLLASVFVMTGILVFFLLRRGARWLVDRLLYRDSTDYQVFAARMRVDLLTSNRNLLDVTGDLIRQLCQALRLESSLLFLGPEPLQARLVTSAGSRDKQVLSHWYARPRGYIQELAEHDMMELRQDSDPLILATLKASGKYLGYMLLGPKADGEVFVEEDRHLITTIAPLLALAIEKGTLVEEVRELNQRLIKVEEAERARMAADLHDGPLQKVILLAAVEGNQLLDSKDLARQATAEIREICSQLRPAILDDLGLVPALGWLLEGLSRRAAIRAHLSLNSVREEDRFFPDMELALFRVAQEAINNVAKHADARNLELSLAKETTGLMLRVVDDGKGFSMSSIDKCGFGIAGMRERIRQLDGSLDIQSAPGAGTTLIARVVLPTRPPTSEEQ